MQKLSTWFAMSLLALFAGCAYVQPAPPRFGVVALTAAHEPCVVLPSAVQAGELVTIAKLHPPAFVPARVRQPIAACGLGLEPGHAYAIDVDASQDPLWASTAVIGGLPPGVAFRDCAGMESIHLTAWRGTQRIWHGYYYVAYDLEPTCTV
ncbi:MAG TPA: hypothetical protein VGF26_00950, partial [Ramlibacter sp.]